MARLVLLIQGCFLIFGSLMVLWWVSPPGQALQRQMGLHAAGWGPRDVALLASGLAAVGFIFAGGYAIQRFVAALSGAVMGGRSASEGSARPMLLWGLFGYLVVAALFGVFVLTAVDGTGAFEKFADPHFLRIVLTWPYHLMAAIGVFGLPTEAFY